MTRRRRNESIERVCILVAIAMALSASVSQSATYQRTDGSIVDPIRRVSLPPTLILPDYALGDPHPYSGSNLGPGTSLVGASLISANLVRADLVGADLSNAVLYYANLLGADLTGAVLSGTQLAFASYDANTLFPVGFDPAAAFMTPVTVINNGSAPPNPANGIDVPFVSGGYAEIHFIDNQGCDSTAAHPCPSPGVPTTVSGTGHVVTVSGSSSFSGAIHAFGQLWVRDSASAVASALGSLPSEVRFTASDDAELTVTGCADSCSVGASGTAEVTITGGVFADVSAGCQSYVLYGGSTDIGDGISVFGDAVLEMLSSSSASVLSVSGGTAILNSGAGIDYWVTVGPDGLLELRGGHLDIFQFGMQMDGELSMSSGAIDAPREGVDVQIGGYASLRGGTIREDMPDRGISIVNQGLVELSGTNLEPLVQLWARDQSRVRIFGSGFAVNGSPIGLGSVAASAGAISATLDSGIPIDNAFRHRGGSCGAQSCTGRVIALAPGLDWDQDGWSNAFDNCAEEPNGSQSDGDADGTGDACFAPVDLDRDGVVDGRDNCRVDANSDQADADADGVGDGCDRSIVFWGDQGIAGCTRPPQNQPFAPVTNDLANDAIIDRAAEPCNCFGIEMPGGPGVASVRFIHRRPSGETVEFCENAAPFALGLAPGQPICSTSLDQDGIHRFMATPFSAPNCAAGTGLAQDSSIRTFTIETPEPGVGLMLAGGVAALAGLTRRRQYAKGMSRSRLMF